MATLKMDTASPINVDKLERQNRIVYQHLASGKTITFLSALRLYRIYHLNSRISDLRNRSKINIEGKMITVMDSQGNKIKCKKYKLAQE